uniref:L1 transposable element RRM domain-containing protein n=1 Tax=Amphilophus citrinellus TaxID=61819 RepID=A0A3Q0T2G0_AMPCI
MPKEHKLRVKTTGKEGSEDDASNDVETEQMEEAIASPQTNEASVLEAIHEVITSNQEINDTIGVFLERLSSAETHIGNVEDKVTSLKSKETSLRKKVEEIALKVDDLENRSRRSNVRIIGLPEKTEHGEITAFLQTWLWEVLGRDAFPSPPIIERAHRLQGQSAPGNSPRVIIVKFLNYQDKVRVMTAARLKGKVMYNGSHVMFFPDLSTEVLKRRKQYNQVKQQLRDLNINFGLIFPAKMRIFHRGNRFLFHTPSEVEEFIRKTRQPADG